MRDKIKLLNEGNQRLSDLYTDGIAENRNLQNKLDTSCQAIKEMNLLNEKIKCEMDPNCGP